MRKIANTAELKSELRRLLEAADEDQPSRVKLAAELRALSDRLAGPQSVKTAARLPKVDAGSGATKEQLVAALIAAANNIYDMRGETRPIYQAMQDAKDFYAAQLGAVANVPDALFNRLVDCRDAWNQLDRLCGEVASGFEVLARDLKKVTSTKY